MLGSLLAPDSSRYSTLHAVAAVGTVAVLLVGWLTATARWAVRVPSPAAVAVAVNTVARAYRELESAGRVHCRVRHGTVVAPLKRTRLPRPDVHRRLDAAAGAYALACQQLGVTDAEALAAVRRHLARPARQVDGQRVDGSI